MREIKPWILLLWGAPAAGKSTLANNIVKLYSDRFGAELCHLGTDRLNRAVLGEKFDGEIRESLYSSIMSLSEQLLAKCRPILVEGTFLNEAWRRRLREVGKIHSVPLLSVQIECRLALREQRNSGRAEAELVPARYLRLSHERAKNQAAEADFVFDTELMESVRLARFLLGRDG